MGGNNDTGDMAQPPQDPTTAIINVHYPAGSHSLALRGSDGGLNWTAGTAPTSTASNVFTWTVENAPASFEYKPLLDDTTWSRGANYVAHAGKTVDVYPHFINTSGTVKQLFAPFNSTNIGARTVWVYLPASYDENTLATYPVLYMHDGQNLFDPSLAFGGNEWQVDESLNSDDDDNGKGHIAEVIVVAPENGGASRIDEYTPVADPQDGGGHADKYLAFLVDELKPQVDKMLRTRSDAASTGVMGSSLGGLVSSWIGLQRPDVFGQIGAMSPSTWWDNNWIISQVMAMGATRASKVYVDCGDGSADDYVDTSQLVTAYTGMGYVEGGTFLHVYAPGAQHNEVYWALRFPGAAAFLFPEPNRQ